MRQAVIWRTECNVRKVCAAREMRREEFSFVQGERMGPGTEYEQQLLWRLLCLGAGCIECFPRLRVFIGPCDE